MLNLNKSNAQLYPRIANKFEIQVDPLFYADDPPGTAHSDAGAESLCQLNQFSKRQTAIKKARS